MRTLHSVFLSGIKRSVEMLTKPYFVRLVKNAYNCRHSAEHKKIMTRARKWYGLEQVSPPGRFFSRWFMDFIIQAQYDIFASQMMPCFELGLSEIGVGNLKIRCSTGDINSSIVYLLGYSDNITFFHLYRIFALQNTVAVDVGANLGMHTLVLSDCVMRGTVFSFEPRRSVYARLIDNLNVNGITNVVASDKALGDSVGESRLHSEQNDFNIGKARMGDQGNQVVDVTTLDHALQDPPSTVSLIKIDTEGCELQVLRGAASVMAEHRPVIVCEFSPLTYSLGQLKGLIPYPAHYFRIPYNRHEKLEPMQDGSDHPCDILILPEEKLTKEVWDKLDPSCNSRLNLFPSCAL